MPSPRHQRIGHTDHPHEPRWIEASSIGEKRRSGGPRPRPEYSPIITWSIVHSLALANPTITEEDATAKHIGLPSGLRACRGPDPRRRRDDDAPRRWLVERLLEHGLGEVRRVVAQVVVAHGDARRRPAGAVLAPTHEPPPLRRGDERGAAQRLDEGPPVLGQQLRRRERRGRGGPVRLERGGDGRSLHGAPRGGRDRRARRLARLDGPQARRPAGRRGDRHGAARLWQLYAAQRTSIV